MDAKEAEQVQRAKVGKHLDQERPGDAASLHKSAQNQAAAVDMLGPVAELGW